MMRRLAIFFIISILPVFLFAQNSKKVKALKKQQSELQNTIKKKQREIETTKKEVTKGQKQIHYIGRQLEDRLTHIRNLEREMDALDSLMGRTRDSIALYSNDLAQTKARFTKAIRLASTFHKVKSPLLFVLSSTSIKQMYRRARYTGEYVTFQHDLGKQIQAKRSILMGLQNRMLANKSRMNEIMREVMTERRNLNSQQVREQNKVSNLQKRQKGLSKEVSQQQKELQALNKKIDDLIAYEIEQARKKAEAEARRKAEAEARRKNAQQKGTSSSGSSQGSGSGSSSSSSSGSKVSPSSWLTPEEKQLMGSFEQNRGRLPVPITGQYRIGNHFGAYTVPGLSHVKLDNKGTNYVGKPGARARSIYDGVVSAVFQFSGTKNVLVRHGSYISVYCNLSSVIVAKGQKLKARDIIGSVADDGTGNCVLHFQLRKETTKLNPETWIGR